MKKPAPPRVEDPYAYWTKEPPAASPRCAWWVERISEGWRPNSRVEGMGYDDSSFYYGVYVWEYLHVLRPLIDELEVRRRFDA